MSKTGCWSYLICPVCARPLQADGRSLRCAQNHTFDRARSGYVNLLPANKKLAETVGDSSGMLQARRRFLARGWYDPLRELVGTLAAAALPENASGVVLDAGCGQGSYLTAVVASVGEKRPLCLLGMDVAKTAVNMAARQMPSGVFFVADVYRQIPVAAQSVHALLNVFAPRNATEFARLLAPGGRLISVIPQPRHLQSLRDRFGLLDIEAGKAEKVQQQMEPHFELLETHAVSHSLVLDGAALADLVAMTPSARHLSAAQRRAIEQADTAETEAQFEVLLFASKRTKK